MEEVADERITSSDDSEDGEEVAVEPGEQPNEGNELNPVEVNGRQIGAAVVRLNFGQRVRDRFARLEQGNRRNDLERMHRLWELEDEAGRRRLREEERREALREWRRRRRNDEGEEDGGRDDEPRDGEARDAEEAGELFAIADGDPIRMRWPWMRNLRWEDEDESDSDGDITDGMIEEAKALRENDESDPSSDRFSRACLICVTENPRQRAVFTQCGHIVCFSCAVDNAKSNATNGKCVYCQKKSSFVKMFEELDTNVKSETKNDVVSCEKNEMKSE